MLYPLLVVVMSARCLGDVSILPWGPDALRVRVAPGPLVMDLPTALLPDPAGSSPGPPRIMAGGLGPVINGNIRAETDPASGLRRFVQVADGRVLLTETALSFGAAPVDTQGSPAPPMNVTFGGGPAALFGLGQQRQACYPAGGRQAGPGGRLCAPGEVASFVLAAGEGGAANTLPFVLGADQPSSRGGAQGAVWAFWMNVPAMGTFHADARRAGAVQFGWQLACAQQLDYVVMATPAAEPAASRAFALLSAFSGMVGRSPGLPGHLLGYWHSKNRYASQADLVAAASGFAQRGVPVDVIVIDWMHWRIQGDWCFDPAHWPDPTAMVQQVAQWNMSVMVTVWPFSQNGSRSFDTLLSHGWATRHASDPARPVYQPDGLHGVLVDPTIQAARAYVWSLVKSGYYDHGIKVFWLDASEPEYYEMPAWGKVDGKDAAWQAGNFQSVGQLFTDYWVRVFADGMRGEGEASSPMLARSLYAGAGRHGAGLWSGDIWCTWDVLRTQVDTGLSAQMSGVALWTTDIGGFGAPPNGTCEPGQPAYDELVVRWFQYGATCPIFRQHGSRPTEIWNYGPQAEAAIGAIIKWRHSVKPYLARQMAALNSTGRPLNRPLWWDFPGDPLAWPAGGMEAAYMFGDNYLAAPVVTAGALTRDVYLPCPGGVEGCSWKHVFSGKVYAGGVTHTVPAPLNSLPLFERLSSFAPQGDHWS
eukprot:gene4430-804_t